jgi:CheY-like chemotaxis protein
VEDNPGDVRLLEEALTHQGLGYTLDVLPDGAAALRFCEALGQAETPCPDLILLDLALPCAPGHEILRGLRALPQCARTPVVILTASVDPADQVATTALGASAYFRKPLTLEECLALGGHLEAVWHQSRTALHDPT